MIAHRHAAAVLAALVLVSCAACGGSRGTSPPLPAACDLLTQADAEALAQEVSGSLSSTLDDAVGKDPGQCSYTLGADTPPKTISLIVRRAASPEQAAGQQEAAESGLQSLSYSARIEKVAGLGDDAFWVGGQLDQLHVRRGDTLLNFTVQVDKQPLAAARTLAGKALARLARQPGKPHA